MTRGSLPDNSGGAGAAFQLEAVLSIDDRGQIVIPQDVRERPHIKDGDNLALVSWTREGKTCCLSLIRAEDLSPDVVGVLHAVHGGREE